MPTLHSIIAKMFTKDLRWLKIVIKLFISLHSKIKLSCKNMADMCKQAIIRFESFGS
jgi:hypothetical protein